MNLLHRCCRVGLLAVAAFSFPAAAITLALEPSEYELEKVRYATDHCLHLRRFLEEEPVDAASRTDVQPVAAAASGVDAGADDSGANSAADAAGAADASSDDGNVPEVLLSSRFNGESCEGRSEGAVIGDDASLPIALDAVGAVHAALTVAPEWIDESDLALELQGCWRRGAVLSGVDINRDENEISLYLQGKDCAGTDRYLLLRLPIVTRGGASDYRREKAIVAEERTFMICGTALLGAAAAEDPAD